jgi:hypothetical protein
MPRKNLEKARPKYRADADAEPRPGHRDNLAARINRVRNFDLIDPLPARERATTWPDMKRPKTPTDQTAERAVKAATDGEHLPARIDYTPKENEVILAHALLMEKLQWLREHPGKTRRDFQHASRDGSLREWRGARAQAADAVMRAAFLRDHPGRFSDKAARAGIWRGPLPEHLCQFDTPFPGYEAVAANVIKWLDDYEAGRIKAA